MSPLKRAVAPLGAIVTAIILAGCASLVPLPSPAPSSFVVFLCRASDVTTTTNNADYYTRFFAAGPTDLLHDYFLRQSAGRVDISGSRVFGWFNMAVDSATLSSANRNNSTPVTRRQTAQDCVNAAVAGIAAGGNSINLDEYKGIVTVINVTDLDVGAAGRSVVVTEAVNPAFLAHEMLHAMGLQQHSWRMQADTSAEHSYELGNDSEYGDCWDIASHRTCTYMFNASQGGVHGPELNIAYRELMGWTQPGDVVDIQAAGYSSTTVRLKPVSDRSAGGPRMARISFPVTGAKYVVEYRTRAGYDSGIPAAAVSVREFRNSKTYLVVRQNGRIGFVEGERFLDPGNFLSISITAADASGATIVVDPRFTTATLAAAGEKCGDKFLGEVRMCVAGTVCRARRTGILVSTEYFCLPP